MNNISIDGDMAFTENVYARFKSYGLNVINNIDGQYSKLISQLRSNEKNKPTLLCMKTRWFGSPNKQGTASVHGAPP